MPYISSDNLVKLFGGAKPVRALDGLSLEVREGEVFGLLGPNGSGKTTFVRCCLNIIFPTSGHLTVFDKPPGRRDVMRNIGYLPENPSFYDHLNAFQFLTYHSELAGIPLHERKKRVNDVLETVRLQPDAFRRRLRTYSKGMLQRVGLAQAMLNRPKLLFLDEPQTGLDPIGRRQVKDIMRSAVREGTTVLFSSHVLGDVEDVADRVAIIHKGTLRKIASLKDMTLDVGRMMVRLTPEAERKNPPTPSLLAKIGELRESNGFTRVEYQDGILSFSVSGESEIPGYISYLTSRGFQIYGASLGQQSLEDVFLKEFGELDILAKPVQQQIAPPS